jgi:hypothetical protein
MYRQSKPIRVFVVALLAMSTSVAAVCTPVSAQSVGSGKEVKASRTACCCGTEDGRCCGMGCCMRQPSNQVPTSPPLRTNSEKEHSQLLALVGATCEVSQVDCGSFNSAAQSDFCGSLAAGTLQSQHIRIQT